MLQLKSIAVTLSKDTALANQVLHNFDLTVNRGEFVMIVGSNGSGKSTLFNTIAGFIKPDNGQILLDGIDVTWHGSGQRVQDVALVMQDPRIGTMPNMTLEENLNLAFMRGKRRGFGLCKTAARRNLYKSKLAQLNMQLENKLDHLVGNLSGGQRQALSLIMAIIADYKILLLDEITAALDPKSADHVMQIAAQLVRDEGRTALMITHNMQYALSYGDRTLLMQGGKITRAFDNTAKNTLDATTLAMAIAAA